MPIQKQNDNVSVTNLRLKFPGEASLVFKDLSFSVAPGEKVLLLGPSGCGKSTLLQVLSGIIPHSIEVPLKYDDIQLPQVWGFVFQDPDTQFCMPYVDEELAFVLENLRVPRDEMDALIAQSLAQVGLHALDPHTLIQDLSQGMKQRLALASVLLLQPEVLFLDEPSALLDPEGTVQIWEAVKEVATNKTVIIVEHKIDHIADWVDRVVLFNHEGEIIADGDPQLIFSAYKKAIAQYGIWYPNVWDDYIASAQFTKMKADRNQLKASKNNDGEQSLLAKMKLKQFKGYRGKSEKISIPQADIAPGSWITVIGDNGAGKSTLLLSLIQLLHTTGRYEIDGQEIVVVKKKKTPPKQLSLVFQNPELQFVTNTIFDELAFSLERSNVPKTDMQAKVNELLTMFHLKIREQRHPYQLSMGQKRRLSIATAFAQQTEVLLLDEPTFGQDARNTFAILEQLEQLRLMGTTIIMVTHDMNIVTHFATEVWVIDEGKLVDRYTPSDHNASESSDQSSDQPEEAEHRVRIFHSS